MSKVKRPLCLAPATQLFNSRAALLVGLLLLLAYCSHISGSSRRTSDSNDNSHIGRKRNINSSAHAKLANDTMFVGLLDTLLVAVSSHAETAAKVGPDFWNGMGNIAEVRQEVLDFLSYADQPCIKTLCEVGFNAGHSATVLLSANDTTVLHVFDMASLPFASAQVKLMKRVYGKRFHFYKGNSVNLLPWFQQHKTHCDLFSIDGDHTYEGAITDFWNALQLMRVGGSLVADDVSADFDGVVRAWGWIVSNGYIRQQHCNTLTLPRGLRKGWCMGHVLKVPASADAVPPGYKLGQAVSPDNQ